jgi:predicted  nucleic acid-binding Zn-ribbon protein
VTDAPGLEQLLDVQERDSALDQLAYERETLPERTLVASVEARLADLRARAAVLENRRQELSTNEQRLEEEIASVVARIQQLERRMYGGEVSASRELSAMAEEVQSLGRRRSSLEDREIELMEEREPVDRELAALAAEQGGAEQESERDHAALAAAEAVIDEKSARELEAREAAATGLPSALLTEYERLRKRLGGVGAARFVNGSCTGCHLTLPASETDRIRHAPPDALLTCEQCGRILVR